MTRVIVSAETEEYRLLVYTLTDKSETTLSKFDVFSFLDFTSVWHQASLVQASREMQSFSRFRSG